MKISWLKSLLIFLSLAWVSLSIWLLPAYADNQPVDIYFYHSKTCPHCLKQKPLMEAITQKNPRIKLHAYEVHENIKDWQKFIKDNQLPTGAVPRTLIGKKIFVGYTEEAGALEYIPIHKSYLGYRNQIINAIEEQTGKPIQLSQKKVNELAHPPWLIFLIIIVYGLTYPLFKINRTYALSKNMMYALKQNGIKSYFFDGSKRQFKGFCHVFSQCTNFLKCLKWRNYVVS